MSRSVDANADPGGAAAPDAPGQGPLPSDIRRGAIGPRGRTAPEAQEPLPPVTVKDILWWLYLYPLRGAALALPPAILRGLVPVLDAPFQIIVAGRKRIVRERMALAFGSPAEDPRIRRIARRFVRNAVRRAIDDLIMDRLPFRPGDGFTAGRIQGIHHLDDALAQGRGVIVATGHFYANRIGKRHLADIGYPLMSVRHHRPPDRWMGRLGQRRLQPRYVDFLHGVVRDEVSPTDPACSLRILERLRSNGIVNVHIDAAFSRQRVSLLCLGRPRRFATGFMDVVRLTRAAIVPMLCLGSSAGFSIEFGEPFAIDRRADAAGFVRANLPLFASLLESQVLAHPEEWELWLRI